MTATPPTLTTVLVTGSRKWTDQPTIAEALRQARVEGATTLIEGGARGADTLAREAAREAGMTVRTYPANWQRDGAAAGPRRNKRMLKQEHVDLVLAFPLPDSIGTIDMMDRATRAGIPVWVFTPQPEAPPAIEYLPEEPEWQIFAERIDDLLNSGAFPWASETLEGILETVRETQRVTVRQVTAVNNIEEAVDPKDPRDRSRR